MKPKLTQVNYEKPFILSKHSDLERKYKFKSTSQALFPKTIRCQREHCTTHFQTSPWKTGIDRTLCLKHRNEVREAEANQLAEHLNTNNDIDKEFDPSKLKFI